MSKNTNNNSQNISIISLAWIVLGWAIAWFIGGRLGGLYDLHWRFDLPFHLKYSAGWTLAGLIGGLFTGSAFFYKGLTKNWKYILWITLGWAFAGMAHGWLARVVLRVIAIDDSGRIAWTYHTGPAMAVFGLIGGVITAIILVEAKVLSSNSALAWIPLGWALGCYLGAEHLPCQEWNLFCYHQQWIEDDRYFLNASWHFSILGGFITWLMIRIDKGST
jgi:hypothetical protein